MAYSVHSVDVESGRQRIADAWGDADRESFESKFQWIYRDNPAGPAIVWILHDEGSRRDVGLATIFPRLFRVRGRSVRAGIAGDLQVHEGHRQAGPALQLERAAVQGAWERGIEFMYGFPNALAEPVMKRIGYRRVGPRARYVKILRTAPYFARHRGTALWRRPFGFIVDQFLRARDLQAARPSKRKLASGPLAGFDDRFDALWGEVSDAYPVLGERDSSYLRWRYPTVGRETHGVFGLWDRGTSDLRGYVVHRRQGGSVDVRDAMAPADPEIWSALLAAFSGWARGGGAHSLVWTGLQNEMLEQLCLKRAAFLRRPDPLHVYAFPGPSVAAGDPDFMNSAPWMLFQSDDDCP